MSPIHQFRPACILAVAVLAAAACDRQPHPAMGDAPPAADAPQPPLGELDPAPGQPGAPPPSPDAPPGPPRGEQAYGPGGPEGPWQAARDRGAAWRGIGQEPGWMVEIHPDSLVYTGDYGAQILRGPTPAPLREGSRVTWNVATGQAELRIVFEELPCTDIMSGFEFPWTVHLSVNGQDLRGCGRRL
jgi:uncharacterized membrane protein